MPAQDWLARLIGHNARACMINIPFLSLLPLAAILAALRLGATTRPVLSGAVAGLLAAGIGASFYAAHCPDDSPLFVATWYSNRHRLHDRAGRGSGAASSCAGSDRSVTATEERNFRNLSTITGRLGQFIYPGAEQIGL